MVVQADSRGQGLEVFFQGQGQVAGVHVGQQCAGPGFGPSAVRSGQGLHGQVDEAVQAAFFGQARGFCGQRRVGPDGQGHGKGQGRQGFGRFQALAHGRP